jgi:hypothetical protein
MNDIEPLKIKFCCPPELEATLPRPLPAVEGLPGWFKSMPIRAFSEIAQLDLLTVKKCPPFIDAMTCGFLIPLATDVRVDDGEFSWDHEVPLGSLPGAAHSPLDFHDNSQVTGSPFFEVDRIVLKFNTWWTVELPPGYSLLITHPLNRADLPFVTLSGLVDADRYHHNFLNFPARWRDPDFSGVLAKGTPIAQCIPIKREDWTVSCEALANDAIERLHEVQSAISNERDVYRRRFRAPKR